MTFDKVLNTSVITLSQFTEIDSNTQIMQAQR